MRNKWKLTEKSQKEVIDMKLTTFNVLNQSVTMGCVYFLQERERKLHVKVDTETSPYTLVIEEVLTFKRFGISEGRKLIKKIVNSRNKPKVV